MAQKFSVGDRIELRDEFRGKKANGWTATVVGFSKARTSLGKLCVLRDGWQRSTVETATQWQLVEARLGKGEQ